MAALGAAVLIAVQLPAMHWFYFYVAWFMPFVLVALFASNATDETGDEAAAAARLEPQAASRVPIAA